MKIVSNGTHYAIERRFMLFWKGYVDLKLPNYTWPRESEFFRDCITTDKKVVCKVYENVSSKFKPVKLTCCCAHATRAKDL